MRRSWHRGVAVVGAVAFLLAGEATAAPGDLDPSFGTGGIVVSDLGGWESISSMELQGDGRILVAGISDTDGSRRFALARYLPNGAPDTTFGSGGSLIVDEPATTGPAIALQADGKIVLADRAVGGLAVYRFLPSGAPDDGFGQAGRAVVPVFIGMEVVGAAVDGAGRIVVGQRLGSLSGVEGIVALRLTPAGIPDASFGTDGKVEIIGPFTRIPLALTLQPDGKPVFSGYTLANFFDVDMLALRLTLAGLPDPNFGTNGEATVDLAGFWDEAQAIAVDNAGRIVIGGRSYTAVFGSTYWSLARLTPDGAPDSSFGVGGKATLDPSAGDDVALALATAGGRVLATGQTGLAADLPLVRLTADGSVDGTFGTGGFAGQDTLLGSVAAWDLAVQPDGRAITAGTVFSGLATLGDFALARYLDAASPTVVFPFEGFLATFQNPPVLNIAQSANVQKLYFRLGGDRGLDVLAPGSPQSRRIDCVTRQPVGPLEQAATPTWDALSYQPTLDRYYYPWKPPKGAGWGGTCREFVLTLADGTEHRAWFQFVG